MAEQILHTDDDWYEDAGYMLQQAADVIEREKRKPVRNFDKYETAKDAFVGFNKMCSDKHCDRCPFNSERNECPICKLNWLYAEAENGRRFRNE